MSQNTVQNGYFDCYQTEKSSIVLWSYRDLENSSKFQID